MDEYLISLLREDVFNQPLAEQFEIEMAFRNLDDELFSIVKVLLNHSTYIENCLSDAIVEVIAGIARGKMIFHERSTEKQTNIIDGYPVMTSSFILLSSGLIGALDSPIDKTVFLETIRKLHFTRMLMEESVEYFLDMTKNYSEMLGRMTKLRMKLFDKSSGIDEVFLVQQITQIEEMLHEIEMYSCTDRDNLYTLSRDLPALWDKYVVIRNAVGLPYLRIVYTEAKNLSNNEMSKFLDNFQSGIAGWNTAISKYDVELNSAFSKFLRSWVRQSILNSIKEESNIIKIPPGTWQTFNFIEKIRNSVMTSTVESKIEAEIEKQTGYDKEKRDKIYSLIQLAQISSLDFTIPNSEAKLVDLVPDKRIALNEEYSDVQQLIRSYIKDLTPEQKRIVCLSHCLFDCLEDKGPMLPEDIEKEALRQLLLHHQTKL